VLRTKSISKQFNWRGARHPGSVRHFISELIALSQSVFEALGKVHGHFGAVALSQSAFETLGQVRRHTGAGLLTAQLGQAGCRSFDWDFAGSLRANAAI